MHGTTYIYTNSAAPKMTRVALNYESLCVDNSKATLKLPLELLPRSATGVSLNLILWLYPFNTTADVRGLRARQMLTIGNCVITHDKSSNNSEIIAQPNK